MDGWVGGWMDGWMDAWMHGCMDASMHGCMDVDACKYACVGVCLCVYMYTSPFKNEV